MVGGINRELQGVNVFVPVFVLLSDELCYHCFYRPVGSFYRVALRCVYRCGLMFNSKRC